MSLPAVSAGSASATVVRRLGSAGRRLASAAGALVARPATASRMALVITALPLLERLLSLPRMLTLLDRSDGRPSGGRMDADADHLVAVCRRVLDPLLGLGVGRFRDNCLTRSLVLFHCLRRAAVPVSVHFGVGRRAGDLAGHCWLELDGVPVAEDPEPLRRFRRTYSYPAIPQGA